MVDVFFSMLIRLGIGLIALMIYMNILGRMQLAPQSAVDQIGNYILGGILGGIIYNLDLEFYKFFMAIIIWTGLMIFVNYLSQKNLEAKRLLKGGPILLMEDSKFDTDIFEKNKINLDDIISGLHQKSIHSLVDVKTIWLEPNGQLTVVLKDDDKIGWVLIEEGNINRIDLQRLDKDEEWLNTQIKSKGFESIEDIFYAEYINGELVIQEYA